MWTLGLAKTCPRVGREITASTRRLKIRFRKDQIIQSHIPSPKTGRSHAKTRHHEHHSRTAPLDGFHAGIGMDSLPIKQIREKNNPRRRPPRHAPRQPRGFHAGAAKLRYGARKALCHPHVCRVAPGIVRATGLYICSLQWIALSNPDRTQPRNSKSYRPPIRRLVTRRQ